MSTAYAAAFLLDIYNLANIWKRIKRVLVKLYCEDVSRIALKRGPVDSTFVLLVEKYRSHTYKDTRSRCLFISELIAISADGFLETTTRGAEVACRPCRGGGRLQEVLRRRDPRRGVISIFPFSTSLLL